MKLSRTLCSSFILAVTFFPALNPVFSQTVPAAYRGQLPFSIGAGASNFNVDWGQNRMFGYAIWGDWRPGDLPRYLGGLGVEVEGRDIDFDHPHDLLPSFREDTLGAGPMYTWRHFSRFRPFGKLMIDFGRLNDGAGEVFTDKVYAPGLGFEYHAVQHLWIRADYEYQSWPGLLGKTLDPQGFTLGASYDFRSIRFF